MSVSFWAADLFRFSFSDVSCFTNFFVFYISRVRWHFYSYRWFPDFNERFAKTPEGRYAPKAGHEQEMEYRETMRSLDLELLVKKRRGKRGSVTTSSAK